MLIKAGVDISRLKRDIRRTLKPVGIWVASLDEELTITSTYEGNHEDGSFHYSNDAYDIRRPARVFAPDISRVQEMIGQDFDVVGSPEYIHFEYDPV